MEFQKINQKEESKKKQLKNAEIIMKYQDLIQKLKDLNLKIEK